MPSINLKKFIAEHYRGGVTARDVIREGVTNSIQAGGRTIKVDLIFAKKSGENQSSFFSDDARTVLDKVIIVDDGEGFTDANLNYFDEVCTSHKDEIGGKGVGRLSFLKFANRVEIRSQLSKELIAFRYTPDFKPDDVVRTSKAGPSETSITISELKDQVNTQIANLVNTLCDDLRLFLFIKKENGQNIQIQFTHNSEQHFPKDYVFAGAELKAQKTREFEIDGETFKCYLFRDEQPRKGIVAMLCADEICVEEYVISKRFDLCRYSIPVTSTYLNMRGNIERQKLELPKTDSDVDMISPVSRKKLHDRIHEECIILIDEVADGEIGKFKKTNVEKLKKYYPFIDVAWTCPDKVESDLGFM